MHTSSRSRRRQFGILFVATLASLVTLACQRKPEPATLRKATIGIQVSPAMALVMVAKDRGFFKDAGLDVEVKPFTAGKFALQAFLGGSLDFAVVGDVPVALASLQGNNPQVISQVVRKTTNEVRVVARRDGDAKAPASYFSAKRRRLATSIGGGPEFYTYSFLRHYQIDPKQVDIVSQRPEDMPAALASGSVDAIAIFDPFAFIAEDRLGAEGQTFTDPALYSELYVLVASQARLQRDPDLAVAMLRGLQRATQFVESSPQEAKAIVLQYTKLEPKVLDGVWSSFDFRLGLTPNLIQFWKEEARWATDTGKVEKGRPDSDFMRLINQTYLKQVDPSAVSLE